MRQSKHKSKTCHLTEPRESSRETICFYRLDALKIKSFSRSKLQYLERKLHHPWLGFMWVLYLGRIGICRCWFLWREENRRTQRKTLVTTREPTTNLTHLWHRARLEPWPHWWEASVIATVLFLLLMFEGGKYKVRPNVNIFR